MRKRQFPITPYSVTVDVPLASPAGSATPIMFNNDGVIDASQVVGIKLNVAPGFAPGPVFIGNLHKENVIAKVTARFFTLTLVNEVLDKESNTIIDQEVVKDYPLQDLCGLVDVGSGLERFRYVRQFNTRIILRKCYLTKTSAAQAFTNEIASFTFYYKPL